MGQDEGNASSVVTCGFSSGQMALYFSGRDALVAGVSKGWGYSAMIHVGVEGLGKAAFK